MLFTRIFDLVKEINADVQSGREAYVDLVTLFYHLDGHITLEEQDFIEHWLKVLSWESPTSAEAYQKGAIVRARDVLEEGDAAIDHYLVQLVEKVDELHNNQRVLKSLKRVTETDHELAESEAKWLRRFEQLVREKSEF